MSKRIVNRKKVISIAAIAIVLAVAAMVMWHFREVLPWCNSAKMVEVKSLNSLTVNGKTRLYFASVSHDSILLNPSVNAPSGDIVAEIVELSPQDLHRVVTKTADSIRQIIAYKDRTVGEMDYYFDIHRVQDEGFEMVVAHALRTGSELDSLRLLLQTLASINATDTLSVSRWAKTVRQDSLRASGVFVESHGGVWLRGRWQRRPKVGMGIACDSVGRIVVGLWQADTLTAGIRTDSAGVYRGALDSSRQPNGHGTFVDNSGRFYEGHWENGMRSDFGFEVDDSHLRVGEWRRDIFRGERMVYTSERIYGIDISRYQHGKGGKYYPIHWNKLRITGLGRHNRKNTGGKVDYPVSFVFIKSTEGTTILNRYYAADYAAAHRHGLPTGAYHFFSTRTPADEQARHFIKHTRFGKGDLPPVLDVEPSDAQIEAIGGAEELFRRIRIWMDIVHKHTGVRPILYVNQRFVNLYLPVAPDIKRDYKVWIARYGVYRPDVKLLVWQLCHDGRVEGIHGDVDINVFNGFEYHFHDFLENGVIK